MGRWEPDAAGRFRAAAMELFAERGYDQTTVADIAARAGLTGRTFFRYFADKREVLFDGAQRLEASMVGGLLAAPPEATAMEAVAAALQATAGFFGDNRAFGRQRQAVIASHPELRERELIKLATLAHTMAQALRGRGFFGPDADLAAEAGIAVFRVAYGLWVGDGEERAFGEILDASLERLAAMTAGKLPSHVA